MQQRVKVCLAICFFVSFTFSFCYNSSHSISLAKIFLLSNSLSMKIELAIKKVCWNTTIFFLLIKRLKTRFLYSTEKLYYWNPLFIFKFEIKLIVSLSSSINQSLWIKVYSGSKVFRVLYQSIDVCLHWVIVLIWLAWNFPRINHLFFLLFSTFLLFPSSLSLVLILNSSLINSIKCSLKIHFCLIFWVIKLLFFLFCFKN